MTFRRYIGFGILIFFLGGFGAYWLNSLVVLKLLGFLSTTYGIIKWFKATTLSEEFQKEEGEDLLTYFWNKILLQLWTFILYSWMLLTMLFWILKFI